MSKAIPARVRDVVHARADGRCEGCGCFAPVPNLHHRKYRSRGGKHDVVNLLALCGAGNTSGCHGEAHGADPPPGWAVHSWDNPETIPVLTFRGRVFLTPDGGYEYADGEDE